MRNFPSLGASSYTAFPLAFFQPATSSSTLHKAFQTHWEFRLLSQMITIQPTWQLKSCSFRDITREKMGKGDLQSSVYIAWTSHLFSRSPCCNKVVKAGNNLQVKEVGGILITKICLPFVNCKLKKKDSFGFSHLSPLSSGNSEERRNRKGERQYLKKKSENEKTSIRMEMSDFRKKEKKKKLENHLDKFQPSIATTWGRSLQEILCSLLGTCTEM